MPPRAAPGLSEVGQHSSLCRRLALLQHRVARGPELTLIEDIKLQLTAVDGQKILFQCLGKGWCTQVAVVGGSVSAREGRIFKKDEISLCAVSLAFVF